MSTATTTGGDRIADAFASARASGRRAALMPFLMGGFPDLCTSRAIGEAYADAEADLIELGIPFADAVADGPVIRSAGASALRATGVALIPVVGPSMPDEGVAEVGARARGFMYTIAAAGRTGERATLADGVASIVARTKASTAVPVALGFGISTPQHAAQAALAGADGVIVGSRLVRAAAEAGNPPAEVRKLVGALVRALDV